MSWHSRCIHWPVPIQIPHKALIWRLQSVLIYLSRTRRFVPTSNTLCGRFPCNEAHHDVPGVEGVPEYKKITTCKLCDAAGQHHKAEIPAASPVDGNRHRCRASAEVEAYRKVLDVAAEEKKGQIIIYNNLLDWGKDNPIDFPPLSGLARRLLATPASMVQSEWMVWNYLDLVVSLKHL